MTRPISPELDLAIEDAVAFLQSSWETLQTDSLHATDPATRTRTAFAVVSACLGSALGCQLLGSRRPIPRHGPNTDILTEGSRVLDQLAIHLHDVTDGQLLQLHSYVEDVATQVNCNE